MTHLRSGTSDHRTSAPLYLDPRYLAALAALALVYFAAAKFGLSLAFATKQVTALWPPTGIAVAALLLRGYRVWPGIWVGAFAINALVGDSLLVAAGMAVGNTLGPVLAVLALRRFTAFEPALARVRDVLALVLFGAVMGMAISALNGVASLALGGVIPWSAYAAVWWVWWVGDGMGVLVFAPLIVAWATPPRPRWQRVQVAEIATLFSGVLLVSLVALNGSFLHTAAPFQLQYAVFPFIIWAALRCGPRETATVIALVTGLAVWGAIHDRGPFVTGNLDQRLILLEMFMAAAALTGLVLSAATAERARAQQALQRAHAGLEQRVAARTAELASANRVLAGKNEEVEAFVYIVSHDLRAPLVNLQGFAKELELSCRELQEALATAALPATLAQRIQAILSDDIAGALRYISASTTKFRRLIDALLQLSRTGTQQFRREPVDVGASVETTLLSLQQSIATSGAKVSVDALPSALGDTTAIGQVFANLIGNALKYLQPGQPGHIEVGGEVADGVAHYWVRDNGAGIPASAQARLFQVFQRFHPQLASGEGMGLAIVKRIIERHGGRIWAASDEGVGATFHFTLPATGESGIDSRKE